MESSYTIKPLPNGNAELYQDGQRVSTGTLDSITSMANNKVDLLGGMKPGTISPGSSLGVSTPTKPQISASSMPTIANNAASAAASGAAALASPGATPGAPTGSGGFSWYAQQALEQQKAGIQSAKDLYGETTRIQRLEYDQAKAQTNFMYGNAMRDLIESHKNSMDAAEQNAAALNPYSQARGAQTAKNFTGKIQSLFQQKARDIEAQSDLAMQAIETGNQKAFAQAQQNLNALISGANKDAMNVIMDLEKSARQQTQFDLNFGLDKERIGLDKERMGLEEKRLNLSQDQFTFQQGKESQDSLMNFINTFGGSPALQNDINTFTKTGKVTPGLAPFIEKGMGTGLAPQEIVSLLGYQTDKARQAQALEEYRTRQMVAAADRQTSAQMRIAANQAVSAQGAALINQGIMPGTPEYATGIAIASSNSPAFLPAGEVEKYTNIGVLSSQLRGLKTKIEAVDKNSALGNILFSKTPVSVQSMTDSQLTQLNTQVQALSGIIGKSVFGEAGNLSNSDIQRVLGSLPSGGTTANVRDALYKNIVGLMANKAIGTLQNHASNAYNVANYAPVVKEVVDKAKELGADISVGGKTTPLSGAGGGSGNDPAGLFGN